MVKKHTNAKLTPQQERFAQLTASGLNQSDAYRAAYNTKRMKNKQVWEEASKLAAHPKVSQRVAELRAPVIAEVRYGLKEAMGEAARAMKLAEGQEQASAMVAAVQLRAKLNGLLVEERRNERTAFENMTDAELDRAIVEAERAIGRAQGDRTTETAHGRAEPIAKADTRREP